MDKRISPAAYGGGPGDTALPQLGWHPSDRATTSDSPHGCQLTEHTRVGASIGTGGPHRPSFTQRPARTGAVGPMPGLAVHDVGHVSDRRDQASTDGPAHAADSSAEEEAQRLEGRVAVLVRLLDDDGQPVTSREQAAQHDLLAEWDHLGRLCVCHEVLPPMPRWFPRSMAAQLIAAAEARSPGSSTVHAVCVEFADGYLTVLEREELSFLPM